MLKTLCRLFKKNAPLTKINLKNRKIFRMDSMGGGCMGNSIKFFHSPEIFATGTIVHVTGWKSRRPKKGDLLRICGKSGNITIGEFIKVELCDNPNDMFFGDVRIAGYDMDYMKANGIETEFTKSWNQA